MNEKYLKVPTVGEIIKEEFLEPMNLSGYELAKKMEVPYSRINDILNGKRQITIDTAIRLSIVFGTSIELWTGLQADVDARNAELIAGNEKYHNLKKIQLA
ncbi:HigA family addiction module antitoxin [Fructilactobacillus frigidiflavus]|uniref:HigA family addiction module antitoxin n=1 Tax=Fructilactobacillus frigidiflavus TaxID=3242688 RepID=UPI003757C86F